MVTIIVSGVKLSGLNLRSTHVCVQGRVIYLHVPQFPHLPMGLLYGLNEIMNTKRLERDLVYKKGSKNVSHYHYQFVASGCRIYENWGTISACDRLYKARTRTTELCRGRHNCSWATSRGFEARLWLWLWLWLEGLSKLRDLEQTT